MWGRLVICQAERSSATCPPPAARAISPKRPQLRYPGRPANCSTATSGLNCRFVTMTVSAMAVVGAHGRFPIQPKVVRERIMGQVARSSPAGGTGAYRLSGATHPAVTRCRSGTPLEIVEHSSWVCQSREVKTRRGRRSILRGKLFELIHHDELQRRLNELELQAYLLQRFKP
jgi:hypothetical protein